MIVSSGNRGAAVLQCLYLSHHCSLLSFLSCVLWSWLTINRPQVQIHVQLETIYDCLNSHYRSVQVQDRSQGVKTFESGNSIIMPIVDPPTIKRNLCFTVHSHKLMMILIIFFFFFLQMLTRPRNMEWMNILVQILSDLIITTFLEFYKGKHQNIVLLIHTVLQ